jgi:hypothetical protein
LAVVLEGCTALSLERHTANQAMTAGEMRYQIVLNTLARMSETPGRLPGLGTVTDGQAAVTDQANIDLKTALDGSKGFTSEAISGGMSRSPNLQWTIDTAYTPDQIRAAQAAFEWVLTGTSPHDAETISLLKLFQVYDDLLCLDAMYRGWLCVGCKSDVPKGCLYVSQCGKCCCWVLPGRLKGLSEFTLILADIATIAPASLYGNATVNLTQPTDKALTQQNVQFRYNEDNQSQIDFVSPIVVYGVPNNSHFAVKWPEPDVPWCQAPPLPPGATQQQVAERAQANREGVVRIRPLPPSGPNPSREYRIQQQQQQLQTQMYLSR